MQSVGLPSLVRPDGALVSLRSQRQPLLKWCSDWQLGSEILARIEEGIDGWEGERMAWLGARLSFALRQSLDRHANRFAVRRYRDLYGTLHAHVRPRLPIQGATYVDLGCGGVNPLGLLFVFLCLGARRGIGVDLDEVQDARIATCALADVAAMMVVDPTQIAWDAEIDGQQVLRNLASFDLRKLNRGDASGIDPARLRFCRDSIYSMPLEDGEADVVMSNAFLEHIPDVRRGLREIARITKRGGYSVSIIDMTDHRRYGGTHGPLDFLTVDSDASIVNGSNRLRLSQLLRLFNEEGFDVVYCHPHLRVEVPAGLRERFSEPFRGMAQEDLEVVIAALAARKR